MVSPLKELDVAILELQNLAEYMVWRSEKLQSNRDTLQLHQLEPLKLQAAKIVQAVLNVEDVLKDIKKEVL